MENKMPGPVFEQKKRPKTPIQILHELSSSLGTKLPVFTQAPFSPGMFLVTVEYPAHGNWNKNGINHEIHRDIKCSLSEPCSDIKLAKHTLANMVLKEIELFAQEKAEPVYPPYAPEYDLVSIEKFQQLMDVRDGKTAIDLEWNKSPRKKNILVIQLAMLTRDGRFVASYVIHSNPLNTPIVLDPIVVDIISSSPFYFFGGGDLKKLESCGMTSFPPGCTDVQVLYKFAYNPNIGLARLASKELNVFVEKTLSCSFNSDSLSPQQISYAIKDVVLTLELGKKYHKYYTVQTKT